MPTLFNVVVDVVVLLWLFIVAEEAVVTEGFGREIQIM